jgi:hypothetical protein
MQTDFTRSDKERVPVACHLFHKGCDCAPTEAMKCHSVELERRRKMGIDTIKKPKGGQ